MTDAGQANSLTIGPEKRGQMTVLGATFLGVGAMVGAVG